MYAASSPEGAFTESLQGFRPTVAARAAAAQASPGVMLAGSVPRDWRDRRRLGSLTLSEPADFIDVEDPSCWSLLENDLAEPLNRLGVNWASTGLWHIENCDENYIKACRTLELVAH